MAMPALLCSPVRTCASQEQWPRQPRTKLALIAASWFSSKRVAASASAGALVNLWAAESGQALAGAPQLAPASPPMSSSKLDGSTAEGVYGAGEMKGVSKAVLPAGDAAAAHSVQPAAATSAAGGEAAAGAAEPQQATAAAEAEGEAAAAELLEGREGPSPSEPGPSAAGQQAQQQPEQEQQAEQRQQGQRQWRQSLVSALVRHAGVGSDLLEGLAGWGAERWGQDQGAEPYRTQAQLLRGLVDVVQVGHLTHCLVILCHLRVCGAELLRLPPLLGAWEPELAAQLEKVLTRGCASVLLRSLRALCTLQSGSISSSFSPQRAMS